MANLIYKITIGKLVASQKAASDEAVLTSMTSTLCLSGSVGHCVIELSAVNTAPPATGSAVSVEVTVDNKNHTLFTGKVQTVRGNATKLRITAVDGLDELARRAFSRSYEKKSAKDIVKDVLAVASLQAGELATGPTFASYLLPPSISALAHLRRLAEICGCSLYADSAGKVHFTTPPTGEAKHRFAFSKDVVSIDLASNSFIYDCVQVRGEGAASEKGQQKAHFLPQSPANVIGRAGSGAYVHSVGNGAARSKSDAATEAKARLTQHTSRPVNGSLCVMGSPLVQPGDLIAIEGIPDNQALSKIISGRSLRASAVRHSLTVQAGYLTRIEL